MQRLAGGEMAALGDIYRVIGREMFALSYTILNDYQLAEDAVQDSLLRISRNARELNDTSKAKSWIITITRNISLDILRKRKSEIATDDTAPEMAEVADDRYTVSVESLAVREALEELGEPDNQIVLMKTTMGFKYKEIADITGMTVEACQKRYQRAISKLKEMLK